MAKNTLINCRQHTPPAHIYRCPVEGEPGDVLGVLHRLESAARHAAGLAYTQAMSSMAEVELPLWLRCGIASWAERHYNPGVAKWFGNQHLGISLDLNWNMDFPSRFGTSNANLTLDQTQYR